MPPNETELSEIIRDLGRLEGQMQHISLTIDRDRAQATDGLTKLNEKIDQGFKDVAATNKQVQEKLDIISKDKAQIQGAWSLATWVGGILLVLGGGLIAKATGWLFS